MENDHTFFETHQFADRYVLKKLNPEEEERFEDHFTSCDRCMEAIELAEQLASSLKQTYPDGIPSAATRRRFFSIPRLVQASLFALTLAAIGTAWILFGNLRVVKNQVADMQIQNQALQERIRSNITPSFFLEHLRGSHSKERIIQVSSKQPFFSITIDLSFSEFQGYRASLNYGEETAIPLQHEGPDSDHQMTFYLSRSFLKEGLYSLRIEGATPASDFVLVDEYPFRVQYQD